MSISDIEDKILIYDLQSRYSRLIDSADYAGLDSIFTVDVHAEYGELLEGLESVKDFISDVLEPLTSVQHQNGNHWAEIEGDAAKGGCYFTVHQYQEGLENGEFYKMGGYYLDELVRTEQGWRISKRQVKVRWAEGNPEVRWDGRSTEMSESSLLN